ncbi:MAG: hypothetical protein QNL33_16030 [Akkermansiaceae bacterium]|jgi:hypothetical protein
MHTQIIIDFVREIGLAVHERAIEEPTFLPGIAVECGELVIDREKLAHPGDVLHEAGHLAIIEPSIRPTVTGDLMSNGGEELAAVAWSYAAVVHLALHPSVVFHEEGDKGGAASVIENFESGPCVGVPLLEGFGMTRYQREDVAGPDYPKMASLTQSRDCRLI